MFDVIMRLLDTYYVITAITKRENTLQYLKVNAYFAYTMNKTASRNYEVSRCMLVDIQVLGCLASLREESCSRLY